MEEKGALLEGVKFYTVRAQLDETLKDIKWWCNFFKIIMPLVMFAIYAASIAFADGTGYKLYINCILICFAVIDFAFSIREVIKLQKRTEKRLKKKFGRFSSCAKIALSVIPAFVAVYQVFTYNNNSILKFITAITLVIVLVARVVLEVVKFVVEKYVQAFVIAFIMDIEKITNSLPFRAAEKVGNFASNPTASTVKWFDKIVTKISGQDYVEKEKEPNELNGLDGVSYDFDDNDWLRAKLQEKSNKYKEEQKAEKKAEKKNKKSLKKQETKEAIGELKAHTKELIHK